MFGTFSHRSEGEIWRHPNGAFCSMYDERFPFSEGWAGGRGWGSITFPCVGFIFVMFLKADCFLLYLA